MIRTVLQLLLQAVCLLPVSSWVAAKSTHEAQNVVGVASSGLPPRVIAVGDFHGDMPKVARVLKMAGIIDDDMNWAGGPDVSFVQTGDVVDRGPDTIVLYKMLQRLEQQVNDASRFHALLGNHEVMNMADDLRYVTPEDVESFGGSAARRRAFSEHGWVGGWLRTLNVSAVVGDSVFVHGGILPKWVDEKIGGLDGMLGRASSAIVGGRWEDAVLHGDGPLWHRGYAQDPESKICKVLDQALKAVGVRRMVIGHTPQYVTGKILRRCQGKVYVIDLGISSAYGGHCGAIEIHSDGTVTGLYCEGGDGPEPDSWKKVRQVRVDIT